METIQEQAREDKIDALLDDLSSTDDSAEAATKAKELRSLVFGEESSRTLTLDPREFRRAHLLAALTLRKRRLWYSLALRYIFLSGLALYAGVHWKENTAWIVVVCFASAVILATLEVREEGKTLEIAKEIERMNISAPGEAKI